MSEELNIEKLREEVNPVYSTAQSCMQQIAQPYRNLLQVSRYGIRKQKSP